MNLEVGDIFSSLRKDGTEFLSMVIDIIEPNPSQFNKKFALVKVREQGKIVELYIDKENIDELKVQKARDNFVRIPHKEKEE